MTTDKKIMLDLGDGKEVDLNEVLSESVIENLKEAGIPMEDGKVNLKALPSSVKTEAEEKAEKMETAANFVKFMTIPADYRSRYGVKQITTEGGSFGASVPTELADAILEKKARFNVLRQRAFSFQLSGPFDLPIEGDGVSAFWVGESDTEDANLVTASTPTLEKKSLDDHYLAALVKTSWKLLDTSAFNIVNYVASLAGRKLAEEEEKAFIGGNGSGKPKGIRQETVDSIAQASTSLAYKDLVRLWYKLKPQYRQNAVFLTSTGGAVQITGLEDTQDRPIFAPGQPLDELFRRPLIESVDIPSNLGDGGDETEVWLGDPFYYWIKDGQNLQMATDQVIERLQTKILVYEAVDAKLTHSEAFVKLTGVTVDSES